MAEKEIKSAFELAMEKAASLDKLTPAELAAQREKEYGPRGAAIASRYMENRLRASELKGELARYRDEDGKVVRVAFLRTLCQSIRLDNTGGNARAFDGLAAVTVGGSLGEARKSIEEVAASFINEAGGKRASCEEKEREKLQALGISGSAVRPALEGSESWREELEKARSEHEARFSSLKAELGRLAGI